MIDAGVLVSVDRGERIALSFREAAERSNQELHTTAPVVAQVWRNGATQTRLAQFLKTIIVHEFDGVDGRRVGELLGHAGTADITDAHLVVTAFSLGLNIVTGDPDDLDRLAEALPNSRPAIQSWP